MCEGVKPVGIAVDLKGNDHLLVIPYPVIIRISCPLGRKGHVGQRHGIAGPARGGHGRSIIVRGGTHRPAVKDPAGGDGPLTGYDLGRSGYNRHYVGRHTSGFSYRTHQVSDGEMLLSVRDIVVVAIVLPMCREHHILVWHLEPPTCGNRDGATVKIQSWVHRPMTEHMVGSRWDDRSHCLGGVRQQAAHRRRHKCSHDSPVIIDDGILGFSTIIHPIPIDIWGPLGGKHYILIWHGVTLSRCGWHHGWGDAPSGEYIPRRNRHVGGHCLGSTCQGLRHIGRHIAGRSNHSHLICNGERLIFVWDIIIVDVPGPLSGKHYILVWHGVTLPRCGWYHGRGNAPSGEYISRRSRPGTGHPLLISHVSPAHIAGHITSSPHCT